MPGSCHGRFGKERKRGITGVLVQLSKGELLYLESSGRNAFLKSRVVAVNTQGQTHGARPTWCGGKSNHEL